MKRSQRKPVLIKKAEREAFESRAPIDRGVDRISETNRWSLVVRSWVIEFQRNVDGAPPAFDRLFGATCERL
jgi:hypothetical protein